MIDPGRADLNIENCSRRQLAGPPHSSRRSGHQQRLFRQELCIGFLARNGLHGRIAAHKLVLNKRQLRKHVAYVKAHSLTEGWTAENLIFQMNRQLSSIPSANIVDDPQGLVWTHSSPRRQSNLEFGIMVWDYIQYSGAREICKVDGNIDSAK